MPRSTAPAVAITVGRSLPKIRIAAPVQADSDARLIASRVPTSALIAATTAGLRRFSAALTFKTL
jgi:hypothetical protein